MRAAFSDTKNLFKTAKFSCWHRNKEISAKEEQVQKQIKYIAEAATSKVKMAAEVPKGRKGCLPHHYKPAF